MGFKLSKRSQDRMFGVHPDLVAVVERAIAISEIDFMVTEGLRTAGRQAELVAKGASRTMNSRHLTGHAVDLAAIVDGKVRWDWPLYDKIASAMKSAARELNVSITWGGDWKSFKDGPHFELSWDKYPLPKEALAPQPKEIVWKRVLADDGKVRLALTFPLPPPDPRAPKRRTFFDRVRDFFKRR